MKFDWSEYLALAYELAGKPVDHEPDEQARLRSAVSRAYYAAYNTAYRAAGITDQEIQDQRDSHQYVWNTFKEREESQRIIGEDGDRIRKHRINADYHSEFPSLSKHTEYVLQKSSRIIARLKNYEN